MTRLRHFAPETDPDLFRCECGRHDCPAPRPGTILLYTLDTMREYLGRAIRATSGPRCPWQNARDTGDPKSEHLHGDGADLECLTSHDRWAMLDAAKAAGFRRLGIGPTFLHVGVSTREEHPADVAWTYYPGTKTHAVAA